MTPPHNRNPHGTYDGLEELLDAIRSKVRNKMHGSILVHIEAKEGAMVYSALKDTNQTTGDLVHVMTEKTGVRL